MATGIVRSVICCVLTESDPTQDSCGERVKESREQTCKFLQAISEDQALEIFDKFSSSLLTLLEKSLSTCLSSIGPCRSKSVQREKLWTAFHTLSVRELPELWYGLFEVDSAVIPKLSPLVYQNVNQRLYEDLIKSHLSSQSTGTPTGIPPQLTGDEENIIRYAAGYVALKLLKKYEQSTPEYVECLSAMAVAGDDSSLLEYTSKWTREINRGGLYEINDMCYSLFREIEIMTRQHLPSILSQSTLSDSDCNKKEIVISAVLGNESVQFYWTMLSVDISNEERAIKLLREIVTLWITIRGFSIAGEWLEKYKQNMKSGTRKSKSLRKELKAKAVQ